MILDHVARHVTLFLFECRRQVLDHLVGNMIDVFSTLRRKDGVDETNLLLTARFGKSDTDFPAIDLLEGCDAC